MQRGGLQIRCAMRTEFCYAQEARRSYGVQSRFQLHGARSQVPDGTSNLVRKSILWDFIARHTDSEGLPGLVVCPESRMNRGCTDT
jgi:hypothetical protein